MIVRTVGKEQLEHVIAVKAHPRGCGRVRVELEPSFTPSADISLMTAEIWLSWDGSAPLALAHLPRAV